MFFHSVTVTVSPRDGHLSHDKHPHEDDSREEDDLWVHGEQDTSRDGKINFQDGHHLHESTYTPGKDNSRHNNLKTIVILLRKRFTSFSDSHQLMSSYSTNCLLFVLTLVLLIIRARLDILSLCLSSLVFLNLPQLQPLVSFTTTTSRGS